MRLFEKTTDIDMKALLSTLWIFILLNMIFRDIHELGRPGMLEEIMSGVVNGVQVTEGLMLLGGVMIEITILMVILSRVLTYRFNRWANIIVGALTAGFILTNGRNDLDDFFFATVEIVALAVIVWLAWRWRQPAGQQVSGAAIQKSA